MDYLLNEPVVLVFIMLGVLLVSAVLIEIFKNPGTSPKPLHEQAPKQVRFTSAADLATILLALIVIVVVATWILTTIR